ncbi:MAG: Nif3-like dinuclear metal center hexameric protein [bacterium]
MADILEIYKALEELAPPELAERWDNCGLQVGPAGGEVRRILLSLDVTLPVAEEAAETGAELIVSHHPLIFTPLQRIDGATAQGKLIQYLVANRIAVFSIHTSLDSARGGVNDALADFIGIRNAAPLKILAEGAGLGRIGELPDIESGTALAARLKSALGLRELRVSGDIGGGVRRVALCSGSGGDLLGAALEQEADIFVTGEINHHAALSALGGGLPVLELGHWKSERIVLPPLQKILQRQFGSVAVDISLKDSEPFHFV